MLSDTTNAKNAFPDQNHDFMLKKYFLCKMTSFWVFCTFGRKKALLRDLRLQNHQNTIVITSISWKSRFSLRAPLRIEKTPKMSPKWRQNCQKFGPEELLGTLVVPCDPLGVSWGSLGVILVSFWEHFGAQNGAKNHQKSDPESKPFLGDFLERFWHPSTLKSEHMARDVLQKSTFHLFSFC